MIDYNVCKNNYSQCHCNHFKFYCFICFCIVQYMEAPLYLAAEGGHTDIVRLLLSHGVNPNVADRVSTISCKIVKRAM